MECHRCTYLSGSDEAESSTVAIYKRGVLDARGNPGAVNWVLNP